MELSSNLISQFVKITNDKKTRDSETIVYGTVVEEDNVKYVKIDGSDLLTPVETTTDMVDGERVTVMIKNHLATVTGNITSPAANSNTLIGIEDQITEVEGNVSDLIEGDFATNSALDELSNSLNNNLANNYMTAAQTNKAISDSAADIIYDSNAIYATKTALTAFQNTVESTYVTSESLDERIGDMESGSSELYATKSSVSELSTNLTTNYSTTSTIESKYATKTSVEDVSSNLTNNYITATDIANTYATKSSIEELTPHLWVESDMIVIEQGDSISDILAEKTKNMNGYSLTLNFQADYDSDIIIDTMINGEVIFNMNGHVITGSVQCSGKGMSYTVMGPGKIKPTHEITDDLLSTIKFEGCEWIVKNIDLYSDGENTNCVGVDAVASRGDLVDVKLFGQGTFKHFISATDKSHLYLDSSSGSCSDIIVMASNGTIVAINEGATQCGTSGEVQTTVSKGSLIIQSNVTFDNTANTDE